MVIRDSGLRAPAREVLEALSEAELTCDPFDDRDIYLEARLELDSIPRCEKSL